MEINEIENKINKFERFVDYSVNNHLPKKAIENLMRELREVIDTQTHIIRQNKLTALRHSESLERAIENLLMKNKVFELLLRDEVEFYREKVLVILEELNK